MSGLSKIYHKDDQYQYLFRGTLDMLHSFRSPVKKISFVDSKKIIVTVLCNYQRALIEYLE